MQFIISLIKRLTLLISIPLFIASIVAFPFTILVTIPLYWLLTGRNYMDDLDHFIEWSTK